MDNSISMDSINITPAEEKKLTRAKVALPMLWISMGSMFMIFGGLTSAYYVRMEKGDWLHFELPQMFYVSTAVIILSSVTMNWVLSAARKNDYKNMKIASWLTFFLGLGFVYFQLKGWGVLWDQKVVFAGSYSNAAGSFLYVLTGLHLAHLFGGLIALLTVSVKASKERYNSENLLGIRLCAVFWHFLDLLWIGLFLFLFFYR